MVLPSFLTVNSVKWQKLHFIIHFTRFCWVDICNFFKNCLIRTILNKYCFKFDFPLRCLTNVFRCEGLQKSENFKINSSNEFRSFLYLTGKNERIEEDTYILVKYINLYRLTHQKEFFIHRTNRSQHVQLSLEIQ